MEKKIRCAVWAVLFMCLTACTGKAPEYPELEGYWKVGRVVDAETGEQPCDRIFWAFQLGVGELKNLSGSGFGGCWCRYEYDASAATLRMFEFKTKGHPASDVPAEKLEILGLPGTDVTFSVVTLDGSRMVLQSEGLTIDLHSF